MPLRVSPKQQFLVGDCHKVLSALADGSFHCCVTSPPYWGLRDYGVDGQLGLEPTPAEYVAKLVEVFREVRRVLRDDGTLWLNLGDSYNADGRKGRKHMGVGKNSGYSAWVNKTCEGTKPKDLIGIPWMVAFALREDGWYLRQDIIWHKPNVMPESVRDRCTKSHEYLFLLSKSDRYFFASEAIKEPSVDPKGSTARYKSAFGGMKAEQMRAEEAKGAGSRTHPIGMREFDGTRNRRSVWTVNTKPYRGAHFATFPPKLIEPCVLAGCPVGGTVLDPFGGAGTTALVCQGLNRSSVSVELNPEYVLMAKNRLLGK